MLQYKYEPTLLGGQVYDRGGLSPEEEEVFVSFLVRGGFQDLSIGEIQLIMVRKSQDLDEKAALSPSDGSGRPYGDLLRQKATRLVQTSEPVRIRQIIQELVKRGLVKRLG